MCWGPAIESHRKDEEYFNEYLEQSGGDDCKYEVETDGDWVCDGCGDVCWSGVDECYVDGSRSLCYRCSGDVRRHWH
jgi:hypothetical protein